MTSVSPNLQGCSGWIRGGRANNERGHLTLFQPGDYLRELLGIMTCPTRIVASDRLHNSKHCWRRWRIRSAPLRSLHAGAIVETALCTALLHLTCMDFCPMLTRLTRMDDKLLIATLQALEQPGTRSSGEPPSHDKRLMSGSWPRFFAGLKQLSALRRGRDMPAHFCNLSVR